MVAVNPLWGPQQNGLQGGGDAGAYEYEGWYPNGCPKPCQHARASGPGKGQGLLEGAHCSGKSENLRISIIFLFVSFQDIISISDS